MSEGKGIWRTVSGRRIFIKDGQSLTDAMRESGKFKGEDLEKAGKGKDKPKENDEGKTDLSSIDSLLGKEYKGVKGQAAVGKPLKEKQGHVKGAFHRDDIGDIDLLWGNERLGLQHIVLQREKEKQGHAEEILSNLSIDIEEGVFVKKNNRGNFEFKHGKSYVIIAPEYHGNKITYVLTAYKRN